MTFHKIRPNVKGRIMRPTTMHDGGLKKYLVTCIMYYELTCNSNSTHNTKNTSS